MNTINIKIPKPLYHVAYRLIMDNIDWELLYHDNAYKPEYDAMTTELMAYLLETYKVTVKDIQDYGFVYFQNGKWID